MSPARFCRCLVLLTLLTSSAALWAQGNQAINGRWRINPGLSDNTDSQVEKALEKSGEKIKSSWFDKRKERYRGGPPEQELYDRFSYDLVLTISEKPDGYQFEYADHFMSMVYTESHHHSVNLNSLEASEDFLEGQWKDGKLLVEMHPRDGGIAWGTYSLSDGGKRLHAEYIIRPASFLEEIKLERVYDRLP